MLHPFNIRWNTGIILFLLSGMYSLLSGQVAITSTPAAQQDTIKICTWNQDTVVVSTSNSPGATFSWSFGNGSPATASGAGPHSISYTSAGLDSIVVVKNIASIPVGSAVVYVLVSDPPPLIFSPSDTSFCDQDAPFTLDGYVPTGGTFFGPGVSGNTFDPAAAGVGTHTISYYYSNGICSDTVTQQFVVNQAPDAILKALGTPILFNGEYTYSRCVPSSSVFSFYTQTPSSTYNSYTIDFGDGSAPQTGTTFPSPKLDHAYPGTGIYDVVLSLSNDSGCVSTDTIRIFYGSNPSVGLSIKGNNIKCLPGDSTGISFAFPITNTEDNPPGTVYIIEVNDGSPPQIFNHPPPDSVIHIFYEPSCGYNTANFNNAFQVKITAQTPCQPNSVATVEPIFISDPPTADFETSETRICTGKSLDIDNTSWGSQNALTGCDTSVILVWEISPNSYTVNSGYMGDFNGSPYNAANWISGTNHLNVNFTKPGYYTITQYVGNQAGCKIDTMQRVICVDSIPDPYFTVNPDSICAPDTLNAFYGNHLLSLCDTTVLSWDITPHDGYNFTTSTHDSVMQAYFYKSGLYTITLTTGNICDTTSFSRTFKVQNSPTVFLPADQSYCGLQTLDFSQAPLIPEKYDSLSTLSYNWQITPATGWNFSGGTSDTSELPQIDFTAYGTYRIIHTITNHCGFDTDTMEVTFYEKPKLDSIPDTLICYNSSFWQTANASLGIPPFTYQWTTSGGVSQSGDSLFLAGLTDTTQIFLNVTDSVGCQDSFSFYVNVAPQLIANAGPDQNICYSDSTTLVGNASGGIPPFSLDWSPSRGLSDTTIANPVREPLDSSTTYVLRVTDSLGCVAYDTVNINVFPIINVDAGPDVTLCNDSTPYILANHTPYGGYWTGPALTDSIFSPVTAGLGSHTLFYHYTDVHGCSYLDSLIITIIDIPHADFSIQPVSGCSELTVQANDSSTAGVNHFWYLNDSLASTQQNPVFTLKNNSHTTDSTLVVKLVIEAGSGCRDSIQKPVIITPKPLADFALPANTCATDSLQPVENSQSKGSALYYWYTSSPAVTISNDTVSQPFFHFPDNQSGSDSLYSISLVVTSSDGCSDTISQNILIHSRPVAAFSLPQDACAPTMVMPLDSSSGPGLTYQWTVIPTASIQNANTSNPTFTFPNNVNDSISYRITLLITDANGCMDSVHHSYVTYPKPTAAFYPSISDSCGPLTLTFTNASLPNISGQTRSDLSFFWDLGNGSTSTDSVPSATYTNTGIQDSSYVISLIVSNSIGCSDTISDTITVHPDPKAEIVPAYRVNCAPFGIDSNVVSANTYPLANDEYVWSFIDMNGNVLKTDTGLSSLNYVMLNDGDSLTLRLITTGLYGCKNDTDNVLFYTITNPRAAFSVQPNSGCSPLTIQVSDSSSAGVNYKWYLNDNLVSTVQNPQFTLQNLSHTQDSILDIKLVILAGTGCMDSTEHPVTIFPKPLSQFSLPSMSCPNDTIGISNTSKAKGASYQWLASSPAVMISNDTAASPLFYFPDNQSGSDSTYTISLIVYSGKGCSDTSSHDILIHSRPVASFVMPAPGCGPSSVSPIDNSSGNNISYAWIAPTAINIQNGSSPSPTFTFPQSFNDSVVHLVYLILYDANGCVDSAKTNYIVYPTPTAGFTTTLQDSCGPFTVQFNNSSSPNQSGMTRQDMTFNWDFGNGQTSTDSVPVSTFINNGVTDSNYTVKLAANNVFGCSDTVTHTITVHPDPVAEITALPIFNCAPFIIDTSNIRATDYPAANDKYTWEILDKSGNILIQDTSFDAPSYTISNPNDTVIYRLRVSSPYNCKEDTVQQLFYTISNPVAKFDLVPQGGCSPLTVTIADSSDPALSRKWYVNNQYYTNGTLDSLTFTNNSPTADSIITVKLVVQAGTGCKDSIEKSVTVHPMPQADFSIVSIACPFDTVIISNNSISKPGESYYWQGSSPAVYISNDTIANPSFSFPNNQSGYDSTFTVTLTVTSPDGCTDIIQKNVIIHSRPIADFSLPAPGCSPVILAPTDLTQGNNLVYQWSISPGAYGTGTQTTGPQFTLPLSQNDSVVYAITLTATDTATGCSDMVSKNYTVYPKPTAAFQPSQIDSCGPFNVSFLNTSSTNQSGMDRSTMSFNWDFGNGQTSADTLPNVTFINNGLEDTSYTVQLIATNAFGCSDTTYDTITVHPDPVASITTFVQANCAPFLIDTSSVNFAHYPTANGSYLLEIFDANSGVLLQTLTHPDSLNYTLAKPGDSITLRLTVYSPFNCKTDTTEALIYSIGKAYPGFEASVDSGCSPLAVTFTDTVPGFTAWDWYSNGVLFSHQQNPAKTFTNSSTTADSIYNISMIATSGPGCPDTITQQITVFAKADVNWTAVNSCQGDSVIFTNQTQSLHPITSWNWDFGDGTNDTSFAPAHAYSSPGKYTVTLTATTINGCPQTFTDTVITYPRPVAAFGINNSCGLDSTCMGQPVTLYDSSAVNALGGTITQWSWDIGNDGIVDYTSQNPTHTFNSTGVFPVKLVVTSSQGCSDTVIRNITIYEPPTAYFKIDTVYPCGPLQTSLTDSSYGLIRNYHWEIYTKTRSGSRVVINTINQQNPNPLPTFYPQYGADTTYFMELTVSNCCGTSTYTDSLRLKSLPVAKMVATNNFGCTPLPVTFQLDGQVTGQPDYLVINYGDGTVDTLYKFPQIAPNGDTTWVWGQQHHTFVNPNIHDTTFTVTLLAVNNCGDSTISMNVIVHPQTIQAFMQVTPSQGCAPLQVTIIDQSYGGTSTSWCLDYNIANASCNQPTALGDTIIHTYTTPGTYTIAQFVSDACSSDTTYKTITVYPAPQALFVHGASTCSGGQVSFTNLSTVSATSISGFNWDFGDGQTSFLMSPSHYYQSSGDFPVSLTVTSINGCTSTYWDTVHIYSPPQVAFSTQNACLNEQPIAFFDSSSASDGQIISTFWKFGDGNSSVSANPQHIYSAPGTYTVTLIHSSSYGCTDSAQNVVNIFPLATADFTVNHPTGKTCGLPQHYDFTNMSSGAGGYYWDFDYNGNRGQHTSTNVNGSYTYTIGGVYDVLLVATNANGCSDSMIIPVSARPLPMAGFEGQSLTGCAPLDVTFNDTSLYQFNGPGGIDHWIWNFGDGTILDGSAQETHTYEEPGTYKVTLQVQTDGGCSDSIVLDNYVTVYPTPEADFSYQYINSKTLQFNSNTTHITNNTSFYWTFGDGSSSHEKDPEHVFNVDLYGNNYQFDVCLATNNGYDCGDTICQTISLTGYLLHVANAFAPDLKGVGEASVFLPKGHSMKTYHLQIYDEWGNEVFESTKLDENGSPSEPWDGTNMRTGTPLPMGAYVWKIEAEFDDQSTWVGKEYKNSIRKSFGTVTLLR